MKRWTWFFITLIGVAISLAGLLLGAWWLTFVAGLVLGAFIGRGRVAIPAGALAGLVAWGVGLAVLQVHFGLGPTASSLAAIMGFTNQDAIPLVLTCLVGLLLGLTGAWLASATRNLAFTSIDHAQTGER
ncbi:MAG TPA: hypothetical protein VND96_02700 [Candidatus Micrarchaeaceae archaeon]|nr:hypothetical protein [Candidatus Micrarchaeaceae archaeon]